MGQGICLLLAAVLLVTSVNISHIQFADGVVPNRRQVLPPIPGYIPVYIQHGDMPPEDPNEAAGVFQVASKNAPPRMSYTIYSPMATTKVLQQSESALGVSDSTTDSSVNNESQASTGGIGEIVSNGVPEESDSYESNGSKL
ncbi:uncharacterized protein LOC111874471 [Cryptotermes secundus]|uniref:uncharacterized protein LOC111874471 n=1 Tax=Cryptotermes secundus TaxID=105785 RepID=UPI000CD7DD2C|nr:uncharacterized protein LOC111874471 [Cryptotermes secundus]